jgi:hypothetical protein
MWGGLFCGDGAPTMVATPGELWVFSMLNNYYRL